MRFKFVLLAVLAFLIVFSYFSLEEESSLEKEVVDSKVSVEIHDLSPYYSVEDMRNILQAVNKPCANQIILGVIPKHNDSKKNILTNKPKFVRFLKEAAKNPTIQIANHGLTHNDQEFNTTEESVEKKLREVKEIWKDAGFQTPEIFIPPMWALNQESLKLVLNDFKEVRTKDYIITEGRRTKLPVKPTAVNWTEGSVNIWLYKKILEYKFYEKPIYRISLHVSKAENPGSLKFLSLYLEQICPKE